MNRLGFAASAAACVTAAIVSAKADIVPVSSTIQDAVNRAKPGDTVFVPPGTYRETVRVLKDNITILGPDNAVIDASGFENGIHVGADIFTPAQRPVCPATAVKNFTLVGLTVRNANANGVFLSGVDGYTIAKGHYIDNGEYATYPSCSNNGQILFNQAQGGMDTCLYVGNDVEVSLIGNQASGCTVGIQIVNSDDVLIRGNIVRGNTAGILAIVDPGNPRTETTGVLIEKNAIVQNNRPNTSTETDLRLIPSGTGILSVGSDQVAIRKNAVTANNTFGVAVIANPLAVQGTGIEPNPDDNQVRRNLVVDNGAHPSATLPGADLFYDASGKGNCFAANTFRTSVPPQIEAAFPCRGPAPGS